MIAAPDSVAARDAAAYAAEYLSPAIAAHSARAYHLGAAAGAALGVPYDAETLYVAAMLHDAGFAGEPDPERSFEIAGAEIALAFAQERNLPHARRVWDAIVAHTVPHAARAAGGDALLLHLGSAADLFGMRLPIAAGTTEAVERAFPRGALAAEFGAITDAHAALHPYGQLAAFRALGLRAR